MEYHFDQERVDTLLSEIIKQLPQKDAEALKMVKSELLDASCGKPQLVVDRLAQMLFQQSHPLTSSMPLSSKDALTVVGFLAATDAPTFLKAASRAVKNEAVRIARSPELTMHVSREFLTTMVAQLSGDDVEVSANATETMVSCCQKLGPAAFARPALNAIVHVWRHDGWSQLQHNRRKSSTLCVRCASAVVDMILLGGDGDGIMKHASASGANDLLMALLADERDPLVQVTALDLIEKLAVTLPMHHERAHWLFSDSVVRPILRMAGGDVEDTECEPDPILGGPALRVVAALCRLGQQRSDEDSATAGSDAWVSEIFLGLSGRQLLTGFHRALHNFETSGELDRLALVDAISSFASSSRDALDLVLDDPVTRDAWLSLSVAQPKLKSVVLVSVAMVLDPPVRVDANGDTVMTTSSSSSNSETSSSSMKLFAHLARTNNSDDPTDLVLTLARSPLPETRMGAYALLRAVARIPRGGQILFSHAGFCDFLVSRDHNEKTKEGREAKYDVVRAILNSEVKGLLADDIVKQLEKYIEQGPHYVKTQRWELATE